MLDLGAGQTVAQQVAAHDQPIRCVRFFEAPQTNAPMLVTGSWDKTIKYWDLRQSQPVATLQCQDRVYTLDVKIGLLVIGTADRYINVVSLSEPTKFYKTIQSPLKWQTRVVSCFKDATGFAVGSIEGRCAFQYVEDKDARYTIRFSLSVCALAKLTYYPALISHSNVTGILLQETQQTSTLSTPSLSTLFTVPLAQQAQMEHSTSGIKMPSTDSKAIPLRAALYQRQISTVQEISLHTQLVMIGVRDTWLIPHNIPIRSCCTVLLVMNASQDPQSRRDNRFD